MTRDTIKITGAKRPADLLTALHIVKQFEADYPGDKPATTHYASDVDGTTRLVGAVRRLKTMLVVDLLNP